MQCPISDIELPKIGQYNQPMDLFWEKSDWALGDKHLKALQSAPFQRPFQTIKLDPGIFIIRGPRQIGKSSWLKMILRDYPDPQNAFYLSCDNISDYKELSALLQSFKNRKLILLDEISFVRDWSRAIKHEIDSGYEGTIILTGSHSADLYRGMDQMPGRLGQGRELQLLPMNFNEFCEMRRIAKWKKLSRLDAFKAYFKVGGFPTAMIEAGEHIGEIPKAKEIYRRWLNGDILKLGKQETYLREILSQIAITMMSPLSLQKLAQRTQMGSHHTAHEYVAILEQCFALRTCYAIDPNTGAFRLRKDKKFYFTDPIIYWIALEWAGFPTPENFESQLAEMVAHEYLYQESKLKNERMGYYHSNKGEIDFYCKDKWALEVKWSPIAQNLSKAFKELIIPQKTIWTQANFLGITSNLETI